MEGEIQISIILAWVLVFTLVAILAGFTLNHQKKTLKIQQERQLETFKASVEAEERQKEIIAKNLHDEILPIFTALNQIKDRHIKDLESNLLSTTDFQPDSELINLGTQRTKSIAHDLLPPALLNFGLIQALEQYLMQLNGKGTIIDLEAQDNIKPEKLFSKTEQANIYRICLEIINNLLKHDSFTYLGLRINEVNKNLVIEFRHDGKGTTNEEIEEFARTSKGLGLHSLKSRLIFLNANINYTRAKVSIINLIIPCTNSGKQ